MTDRFRNDDHSEDALQRRVGGAVRRKQKARREKDHGLWFGLGMFGLVGWSVALPTLIGTALGVWIDAHRASPYSWTLMLLFIGVAAGCLNAWYWVKRESRHD